MSRKVTPLIQTVEQPELPEKAQMRLERDKTYFLENETKKILKRPFVEGEALPYVMPPLATVVEVLRGGRRTFIVGGVPELIITAPPVEPIKEKRFRGSQILQFKEGRIVGRLTKVRGQVVKRELVVPDLEHPGKHLVIEVENEPAASE